jgi:hypothetical protein
MFTNISRHPLECLLHCKSSQFDMCVHLFEAFPRSSVAEIAGQISRRHLGTSHANGHPRLRFRPMPLFQRCLRPRVGVPDVRFDLAEHGFDRVEMFPFWWEKEKATARFFDESLCLGVVIWTVLHESIDSPLNQITFPLTLGFLARPARPSLSQITVSPGRLVNDRVVHEPILADSEQEREP